MVIRLGRRCIMLLRLWYTLIQVVAAVGFKRMRLEIPRDVNPQVAAIIEACWEKWVENPFLLHIC